MKKAIDSIKCIYEKVIEMNIELKVNVDEQHNDITHLKEQCDIGEEDEVQEITAARTPIKKKRPVCVTCNQTFAMTNKLTNYIQKEHTELW